MVTVAAGCALTVSGPVAAVPAGVYAGLAVYLGQRAEWRRRAAAAESAALDAVVSLAADLRAGQPPDRALAAVASSLPDESAGLSRGLLRLPRPSRPGGAVALIRQRVLAAVRVAEATGAPLADLLDRLDADLRTQRLVAVHGAAQAAGATATGALLAALPVAGIGLGYGLGVDPGRVLLHTRVGAGCTLLALALQLAGLAWVGRIARAATGSPG